ncbi:MAG: hypothetical protein JWN65_994 [Solirubrobacterales bacterium]|nr:hypothetical protein [Solirubrobacterales bacterium]
MDAPTIPYGEQQVVWRPGTPRLRPLGLALAWVVTAASVWITAWLLPGVRLGQSGAAFAARLGGDRRQQVQDATDMFVSKVKTIATGVAAGGSAKDAKAQLTSALQQFGTAYEQSLAKIDC